MENTAQQAITLLRNQMTSDDMRQLSDADLYRLESNCHHWQQMAFAERQNRAKTINPAFTGQGGRHGQ